MSYPSNGNRPKLSEKGLLTPDNCVVALIDHQPQMLFGTSNFDRQTRRTARRLDSYEKCQRGACRIRLSRG
jgi:hypothetical protein